MLRIRQAKKARIGRGRVVLDQPLLAEDLVLTGDGRQWVVALMRTDLVEVWRRQARRLSVVKVQESTLLLHSFDGVLEGWSLHGDPLWRRAVGLGLNWSGREIIEIRDGVTVIDTASGEVLDHFDCPDGEPAARCGDRVVIRPREAGVPVRTVELGTGRLVWEHDLIRQMRQTFDADEAYLVLGIVCGTDGRVVASRGGYVFGISLEDGRILWGRPLTVPYPLPHTRDGHVYVWTTTRQERRRVIDLASGHLIRDEAARAEESRFVILKEATGEVVSERNPREFGPEFAGYQEPQQGALAKNHIVFTTRSGLMSVFRLSDGEVVYKRQHGEQLFCPTVEGNEIYVTCADGTLLVFECEDCDL